MNKERGEREYSERRKTAEGGEEYERKTEAVIKEGWGSGLTVTRIAANSRLTVKVVKPQVVRPSRGHVALRGLS